MKKPKIPGEARTARRALTLSAGMLALVGFAANAQQMAAPPGAGNDPRQTMIPNMNCNGEVAAPAKIEVAIGKSTMLKLPEPVINRTLGNPNVAQAMLVAPDTLYLLGVSVGTTNMIVQGKSKRCNVIDVAVAMDATGLANTLRELMPEEKDIRVSAAADSLVLSGTVSDSIAMQRAYELAMAYVRRPAIMSNGALQEGMATAAGAQTMTGAGGAGQQQQQRIVNMLSIAAAQQVMLEVKIAEISKSLIDKLGARVNGSLSSGMWSYQLLSNFLSGTLGGSVTGSRSSTTNFGIEAEKRDGLVKVLAEPTVMAISGQEGSFLAGGKILIPVAQSAAGGTPVVTLQEKDFGVGLRFTPTVLSGGRINLQVAPEVSELSREGASVSSTNNAAQIFPVITTRRASTTVQLADGQSFAIGGLIKNNTTSNIRALPILGEIPILGALFRSTDFQNDKTELVFVVTPRLVKPMSADAALPTDAYRDPSRTELFLGGKLEGKPVPQTPQRGTQQGKDGSGFEMK